MHQTSWLLHDLCQPSKCECLTENVKFTFTKLTQLIKESVQIITWAVYLYRWYLVLLNVDYPAVLRLAVFIIFKWYKSLNVYTQLLWSSEVSQFEACSLIFVPRLVPISRARVVTVELKLNMSSMFQRLHLAFRLLSCSLSYNFVSFTRNY